MNLNDMYRLRKELEETIYNAECSIVNSKKVTESDYAYMQADARKRVNAAIVVSERNARKHNVNSDSKLAQIIACMKANMSQAAIIARMSDNMTETRVKATISYIKRNSLA